MVREGNFALPVFLFCQSLFYTKVHFPGKKNEKAARKAGLPPREWVDALYNTAQLFFRL